MIINGQKLDKCKPEVKTLIDYLASLYGTIIITSGYRDPIYNKKVGGATHSAHITGEAVDFKVSNVSPIKLAAKVLDAAGKFPIKGMGIDVYAGYIHVDIKDRGVNRICYWAYGKNGRVA